MCLLTSHFVLLLLDAFLKFQNISNCISIDGFMTTTKNKESYIFLNQQSYLFTANSSLKQIYLTNIYERISEQHSLYKTITFGLKRAQVDCIVVVPD